MQGDIVKILDSNGSAVASYYYDAWGTITRKTVNNTTINTLSPFRYRGYVYDTDTGLYYLQSRYYDPQTGRFINADDTAFIGATCTVLSGNLFAYCENNSINFIDNNGRCYFGYNGNLVTCHKKSKYDKDKAIKYASDWYDSFNPHYPYYVRGDCANFVSQCLHEGGINMTMDWYCIHYGSFWYNKDHTNYWSVASQQYAYFRRSKYVKNAVEFSWFNLTNKIQDKIIKKYDIKKGDLLYFDDDGDGVYTHASIISSIHNKKEKNNSLCSTYQISF